MSDARRPGRTPLVVAHRGGSPGDVENSLAAFRHALAVGADLIECDLRRAGGGLIVLHHDGQIGGVSIKAASPDQLRRTVPTLLTLEEFLTYLGEHGPKERLVLDLKERDIDRPLVAVIERWGLEDKVLVTSRYGRGLRRLRRRFPRLRVGLSRGSTLAWMPVPALQRYLSWFIRPLFPYLVVWQLRWSGANVVAFQESLLDGPRVRRYHRLGYRVYAWTVDDCGAAIRLAEAGVEMIATNLPADISACLAAGRDAGSHSV
jgi:glycerophosphoryl diester phosphodiesterase